MNKYKNWNRSLVGIGQKSKQMRNYLIKEFEFFNSLPSSIFNWADVKHCDRNWLTKYKLVVEFVGKYNCLPKHAPKNTPARKLGHWVQGQRRNYYHPGRKGYRPLTQEHIQKLEAIPGWFWRK